MREKKGQPASKEGRRACIKLLSVGGHHKELIVSHGAKGFWRDQFR